MSDGIPAPNPIYKIPIKNVTGNANVKIQNLVNVLNWNEFSNYSNWQPAVANNYKSFKIEGLKPQTKYTICRVNDSGYGLGLYAGFNNDNNNTNMFIHNSDANRNKQFVSFTSSAQGVLYVVFYMTNISTFQQYLDVIQDCWVIEGENFKQKEEQNYPFTFAEGQRGMQETQPKDDGIHNIRKQYAITGNETWELFSNKCVRVRKNDIKGLPDTTTLGDIKCNYLIANTQADVQTAVVDYGIAIRQEGTNGIVIRNKDFTTLEQYTNWFKQLYNNNAPLLIEYPLADSALENNIIPYNSTQQEQYNAIKQARSYDDITYITSTSDELGFNMDVESLGNINTVINNLLNN